MFLYEEFICCRNVAFVVYWSVKRSKSEIQIIIIKKKEKKKKTIVEIGSEHIQDYLLRFYVLVFYLIVGL